MDDGRPSATHVRRQLERMLAAREVAARPRVAALLRFFVEESIRGGYEPIEQRRIATRALGLPEAFSPSRSAYVRVNVARLRKAIDAYYAASGHEDPIVFQITPGPYRLIVTCGTGVAEGIAALEAREARRQRPTLLLTEPGVSGGRDGHDGLGRHAALQAADLLLESTQVNVSGPVLRARIAENRKSVADIAAELGFDYWAETEIRPGDGPWTVQLTVMDAETGTAVGAATGSVGPFPTTADATRAVATWVFRHVDDCFAKRG
jgi:hypothetical protein